MTVDYTTGVAIAVGSLGFTDVNGLAFDPTTGTLYGTDGTTDTLLTIDPRPAPERSSDLWVSSVSSTSLDWPSTRAQGFSTVRTSRATSW